MASPLGLRKYRRPDGCHTTIHLPGNTQKSDSDGLGLDVKKVNCSTNTFAIPWLSNKMYIVVLKFYCGKLCCQNKVGDGNPNAGSASSRSQSHTVYIYIQYTYYNYIDIYTLYCRI